MKVHFADKYILNPTHPITISLIGIGGTGSQVLTSLARINHSLCALGHPGIHVTAYDDDIVSEANIGRQLFGMSDLGLNKANVLVTRINRFFGLDWEAVPEKFGCKIQSIDPYPYFSNITISCVDSIKSRISIDAIIRSNKNGGDRNRKLYWMDFGNGTNSGQVILGTVHNIVQPKSKKYDTVEKLKTITELFDLNRVNEKDSGPSCSLAEALSKQDLFVNSTLAQLGCALLWKLITNGMVEYQGLYLNLDTMNVNPIKL